MARQRGDTFHLRVPRGTELHVALPLQFILLDKIMNCCSSCRVSRSRRYTTRYTVLYQHDGSDGGGRAQRSSVNRAKTFLTFSLGQVNK